MFGKLGDMANLMSKAQEMQKNMKSAQSEIAEMEATGSSSGGVVTVVMKGDMSVKSVSIAPDCVDSEDVGILEELVADAVNSALMQIKTMSQERLSQVTGGIDIPGLGL